MVHSLADYLALPENGRRHEIIDGKHYVLSEPDILVPDLLFLSTARALTSPAVSPEPRRAVRFRQFPSHVASSPRA
jgi:hypothetical protein